MSSKYILIFCDEKLNHENDLANGIIKYFPDTEKDTKAEVKALQLVDMDQIPQLLLLSCHKLPCIYTSPAYRRPGFGLFVPGQYHPANYTVISGFDSALDCGNEDSAAFHPVA